MEIKTRAFPFPVLGPNSDDFSEGVMRLSDAAADAAPERYSIRFRFDLTHPDLINMVTTGLANAAVIIECRQNLYRKRHPVQVGVNEIKIPADELRGEVQITPVISASSNLDDYRPRFLNPDYNGIQIRVPRHALLAYGPNLEFVAEPKSDRLRRISSIMRVAQSDEAGQVMRINMNDNRIRVEVSPELFRIYHSVVASSQGAAILASMLVLPVLVDVFHQIKADREGFEDFRWFQVIRARLREIGEPCEAPHFEPIKAAQALLDSPFARGIVELVERLDL